MAPDVWLLGIVATWRDAVADLLFMAITWTGSLWLLLPLSLAIGIARKQALVPVSILAAAAASYSLKLLVARVRPALHEVVGTMPTDFSFPSTHSAQAAACAAALVLAVPPAQRLRALPWLAGWVFLVGFSRIYLQVHWPSDVLTGWVLGIFCALCVDRLLAQRTPQNA